MEGHAGWVGVINAANPSVMEACSTAPVYRVACDIHVTEAVAVGSERASETVGINPDHQL